ncbi:MAG: glutaminyl-peptide cyclotransferase [Sandaracinaceae bacterium]|nr:glutaminyl-peptide cyclotransferase [Sandaracinaceae bacterium]
MARARAAKGAGSKRRKPTRRGAEPAGEREPSATPPAAPTAPAAAPKPKAKGAWWLLGVAALLAAAIAYIELGHPPSDAPPPGAASASASGAVPAPEALAVRVVRRYPHDPDAFTQGLLWHDGHLYESTGQYGRSSVRRVALETGEVLATRSLERRLFGEGLARVDDRLYLLTWQEGEAHVFSLDGLEHTRRFSYDGEGWGLCFDGEHLVMSDGSERLFFRRPDTFRVDRVVRVRDDRGIVRELNELECVDGAVWANVWQSDRIVRIDPASGHVTGSVDASGLLADAEQREADVLNGIAWIAERGRFVITGKYWPWLFEVDFVPAE